ncbi:AraC family transcriptional regulator [Cohnella soli]|uniref:AraC family transcriptional regulator n=1 Tax=Cohnella soli TaxID=425005 RepID=A0ABW0HSH5_9BACL
MFKQLVLKNPFQLFLTISLPFLISALVLLLVQSSLLNRNFEHFALQMIYSQQQTDLQNTSRNVQAMAQSVRSVAITAFFDDMIKDLLYSDVAEEEYVKYQKKMESYKNIYPFLQSIYIYNGRNMYTVPSEGFVFDRAGFPDKGIFPILDDIRNNRSHSIVLREIPNVLSGISTDAPSKIHVYSYLFFDTQLREGKVSEAIILNISEEWVKQNISAADEKNNRIQIVDASGRLMTADPDRKLLSDMNNVDYMKKINSLKEPSGSFRMNASGVDSFITYTDTGVFGWKMVSITPYTKILQEISIMKKKTVMLVLLLLAISMLIMLYFSRRLYLPVKLVIQNYNRLESEQKSEFYNRKQQFLRKLVQTNDFESARSLHNAFQQYRIALDPADTFRVLLLRIDYYSDFCSKYNARERDLLKFGIMNIVSEHLNGHHKHECVEVAEDQILVLMNERAGDDSEHREKTLLLVQDIQSSTSTYLRVSLSVAVSELFEALSNLNFHYLKTVDLSDYRIIKGRQAIITEGSISHRNEDFKYPQEQEKELADALIQGKFSEANRLLGVMIDHASSFSYTALNSVLIRLLLSVRHAVELLESNHSIKVNFNFQAYLTKLQKIETLDEIKSDFHALFEHLAQELVAKKDNKHLNLIEDVARIVQRDFANPALSLDTVADEVGFSSPYVGKLFRKHFLVSVNDYINQIRLTHATEWIATTDDTITDIMLQSGFSSRSHFFTLFKKEHGLTPSQYRTMIKKSG